MGLAEVLTVLRALDTVGCQYWLEGGWGVDALARSPDAHRPAPAGLRRGNRLATQGSGTAAKGLVWALRFSCQSELGAVVAGEGAVFAGTCSL